MQIHIKQIEYKKGTFFLSHFINIKKKKLQINYVNFITKINSKKIKTNSELTDCCQYCFRHWCSTGSINWVEIDSYLKITSFLRDHDIQPQILTGSLGETYSLQDECFCFKIFMPLREFAFSFKKHIWSELYVQYR